MGGKNLQQIKGSRDVRWGLCFAVLNRVFMKALIFVILIQRVVS